METRFVETVSVKLSERNQMVLPKAARQALGIKPGERVLVVISGDEVRLLADPSSWADYVYGLGQQVWTELGGGESFLQGERASWAD